MFGVSQAEVDIVEMRTRYNSDHIESVNGKVNRIEEAVRKLCPHSKVKEQCLGYECLVCGLHFNPKLKHSKVFKKVVKWQEVKK